MARYWGQGPRPRGKEPEEPAPRQPVCPSCGCSAPYHSVECETLTRAQLAPHRAYERRIARDAEKWLSRDGSTAEEREERRKRLQGIDGLSRLDFNGELMRAMAIDALAKQRAKLVEIGERKGYASLVEAVPHPDAVLAEPDHDPPLNTVGAEIERCDNAIREIERQRGGRRGEH